MAFFAAAQAVYIHCNCNGISFIKIGLESIYKISHV